MPEWLLAVDDWLFRFVTRGAVREHLAVFIPVGLACGALAAVWSARLFVRESSGTRRLSRGAAVAIVLATAAIDVLYILGVAHAFLLPIAGGSHWVTEGGSVDWAHWRLVYHFILIILLVTATAVDFDQYLIPDAITFPGTLIGISGAALLGNLQLMQIWVDWNQATPMEGPFIPQWLKDHPHWHGLAWSFTGLVVGAGMTWLVRLISHRMLSIEALGFGDVTLMAMIGSFLGWQPTVFVFLLAPLCALVIGLTAKILTGRRAIPYGPYLSAAAIVVLLTWRWLWTPTRDIFGHWPTLVGLAVLSSVSLAALLWLLRLYKSIPVTRRS